MAIIKNMQPLTLLSLLDKVLVRSGNYILPLEDTSNLSIERFESLAIQELAFYNRYFPIRKRIQFNLFSGKVFDENVDGIIPRRITGIYQGNSLSNPVSSIGWKYLEPKLEAFDYPSNSYYVDCWVDNTYDPLSQTFETLNLYNKYFIDQVTYKFIETVGRNRRSFTINELPITGDAESMVAEAMQSYSDLANNMRENSLWHMSVLI